MATRLEEDEQVNDLMHYSDSEEEDEEAEDGNWDDWREDDAGDGQESDPGMLCLFCHSIFGSCSSLFEHCASAHFFDFYRIKKDYNLDFYKCFKLINYVRSQMGANKCWSCGAECMSNEGLLEHLHGAVKFDGNSFPWDDDKYLSPFMLDDTLLYSFGGDDEDEENDAMSVDREELGSLLSELEHIEIDETVSDTSAPDLIVPCVNGGSDAVLSADIDKKAAKLFQSLPVDDFDNASGGTLAYRDLKNDKYAAPSTKITANAIKVANKNYFGSYSSFGIHREMISDKVRTDAYRQAILENPSLLRDAVVMDVGCGTGILSLFAAQAGASRVIAVEASAKMAAVATQVARDNRLLLNQTSDKSSQENSVLQVIEGMVEELENGNQIKPKSVDVLLSEWMGYCLLYESMLSSVLFARDKWLKPGGAILPDTATMANDFFLTFEYQFVAGFGRGATSIPFWENVYGFDMSSIGREIVEDAARLPIIDVVDKCDIVTTTEILQTFDLVTMQQKQMDFTAEVELGPKVASSSYTSTGSHLDIIWCYGVVLWFETGFTKRFCLEKPVNLSTSPYDPSTHWSQTILTFKEPVAIASNSSYQKLGVATLGTKECPATRIHSRISIARAPQHRSIDISLEITGISQDGRKHQWPVQMFNLY